MAETANQDHGIGSLDHARTESQASPEKTAYKSWKKKYRKMRIKFDHAMNESNRLFKLEQDADETARRLTLEIDGLLELLLDNNDLRIQPPGTCVDLHSGLDLKMDRYYPYSDRPWLLPTHPADYDTFHYDRPTQELLNYAEDYLRETWAGGSVYHNIYNPNEPVLRECFRTSLKGLMKTVPHQPFEIEAKDDDELPSVKGIPGIPPNMAADLEIAPGKPDPVAYISAERYDEYLSKLDASLGLKPAPTLNTTNPDFVPVPPHLSDRDLEFKNPSSVYNWLRSNKPSIFLQDGEPASLQEKGVRMPGILRGAGKRAVPPAPSKPDAFEIVEEDGLDYNFSVGTVPHAKEKGKRKRTSDEDGGYRPKGGSSRPKKRKSEGGEKKGSVKKEKKGSPLAAKEEDTEMGDAEEEFPAPE